MSARLMLPATVLLGATLLTCFGEPAPLPVADASSRRQIAQREPECLDS